MFSFAKDIVFFTYLHCGYVPLRDAVLARRGRARAVVLCYHRIGARDVMTKPTQEFRRDLEYLKSNYECISLWELCERLRANQLLKRPMAVVTFDDGYRDNLTEAVPVLQEAGMPATFFVATGFMGTDRIFPHDVELARRNGATGVGAPDGYPKLTWDDLRAMQAAGFEIGAHTVNHVDLGLADEPMAESEIKDGLAMLNQELGERPRAFAFPWGKPANITKRALEVVQEAGYYAAVSAYGGANTCGANPFNIHRVDAGNGRFSPLTLRARVAGCDPDYFKLKVKKLV
ncbi:MAG: polysaccharide deacetylase family protein [Armatimonadota bacterium]|nr:polysaccharide deacetylase family protein [Armatimonadota bacterium]